MSAENGALIRRAWDEMINGNNLDLLPEIYAADAAYHGPDGDLNGVEELRAMITGYLTANPRRAGDDRRPGHLGRPGRGARDRARHQHRTTGRYPAERRVHRDDDHAVPADRGRSHRRGVGAVQPARDAPADRCDPGGGGRLAPPGPTRGPPRTGGRRTRVCRRSSTPGGRRTGTSRTHTRRNRPRCAAGRAAGSSSEPGSSGAERCEGPSRRRLARFALAGAGPRWPSLAASPGGKLRAPRWVSPPGPCDSRRGSRHRP